MAGENTDLRWYSLPRVSAGTILATAVAGYNSLGEGSSLVEPESVPWDSTATVERLDKGTAIAVALPTETALPNQFPQIVSHSATPEGSGQDLALSIATEDDAGPFRESKNVMDYLGIIEQFQQVGS